MPFKANDPKTKAAGKRGGKSGKKYLQTLSKTKLKKLTQEAGKRSGERRRELKEKRDREVLLKEREDKQKANLIEVKKMAKRIERKRAESELYEDKIMEGYME